MQKKEIMFKISSLLDQCEGCERTKGMTDSQMSKYCKVNCEIGKKLFKFGNILNQDKEERNRNHGLTLEIYQEEKQKGTKDKEIAKKYNIAYPTISTLRKKWGIT